MTRWSKLGIIAGGGALPERIARACAGRGEDFYVIRLEGYAESELEDFPGESCGLAEAGKILRILKTEGCDAAVMAGVVQRPDFKNLKPDWRGAALLPKVLAAAAGGDGSLLRVLVDAIEAEGLFVIGAEEVTADLAAPAGPLGALSPDESDFDDICKGAAVVRALGALEVGQAAVAAQGLVLAVEAAEGTDAMLERCAALPAALRGGVRAGVLVKRPKPGQELRVDLPTIGAETVRRAHKAGLSGIAVEAGVAIVIDPVAVAATADALGLFVYGFTDEEVREK
ncbi:MAG: LpxI family protein [Parvularculaceae bacterium]